MAIYFAWDDVGYLALAIILDVVANVFMKYSDGFKYKRFGIMAVICALLAFTALSQAIRSIPLSVAYGIWGGLGLIMTAFVGMALFRERIRPQGWLGIFLLIIGAVLMKLSVG